jgi:large subunit ribosomal protein L4
VVEGFTGGDRPSTKAALNALSGLTVADRAKPRTLVVLERGDDMTWLSLRNVPTVHLLAADQLNTYDVLASDDVVFTRGAFDAFVGGTTRAAEPAHVESAETESAQTEEEAK